jgi:hypothetical protein
MKRAQPSRRALWNWPRRFLTAVVILFISWIIAPLRAEVSAVTDSQGRYVRTLLISESRGGRRLYWSQVRKMVDSRLLLNPSGDRMGDGVPVTGEQPGSRQPWVIWSASDGNDREIAFATWSMGRWQGPALLERSDNTYDDLNPRLAFDSQGRPVVAWWRNEAIPRIYLSIYREGAWSSPLPISDASTPSRSPSLRIQNNLAIVTFFTSHGKTVLYQDLSLVPVQMDGNGPLDGPVPPPDAHADPGEVDPGNMTSSCSPDCPDIIVHKPKNNADE